METAGGAGLPPSAWSAYRVRISLSPRPLIRGPKGGSPVACTRWFLKSASRLNPRWPPRLASSTRSRRALTWIRKRHRIETTYRMNDMRWPESLSLGEKSDHHRQSDGKRRKVNIEVSCEEYG